MVGVSRRLRPHHDSGNNEDDEETGIHVLSCALPALFIFQAAVDSLYKPCRATRFPTVLRIEVHRGPGRLHLRERQPLVDERLNTVAHNQHHVPVITHIARVAEPSVTGNHHGASLTNELWS